MTTGTPADDGQDQQQVLLHGERLAAWVEGLGLVDHLAEAGLPTLARDADGRAVWTDPSTGGRLSGEQLTDLERLLRSEGSEPEHAVPVALLLLARHARLREELLATRWFGYESLAEVRGATLNATRFAVHKDAENHRLLITATEHGTIVPAFQLTADGTLRPDLEPVLTPLLAAGMDPWRAWAWLTTPAALLGGLVPEQAAADPETADVAVHAAVRLAERVAADS